MTMKKAIEDKTNHDENEATKQTSKFFASAHMHYFLHNLYIGMQI